MSPDKKLIQLHPAPAAKEANKEIFASLAARRNAPSLEVTDSWLLWFEALVKEEHCQQVRQRLERERVNWLNYCTKLMSK